MALNLELRKTYLGATDLSAISGLSSYRKPGDVWLEKMGQSTFSGNAATEWGTDLEPIVAMRHGRRFGVDLLELPNEPIYHPLHPFIAANVDRIYRNQKRVLECKTAAEDQLYGAESPWGEDGEENAVPLGYLGQTNTYIGILGYEDGYLSAMFLGKSRIQRDYPITFDQGLYDLMIGNGVAFWETYVRPRIQPPVELFSPEVAMKAVALRALSRETVLEASPEIEAWAAEYREIGQKIDELTGQKKLLGAHIGQWIAEQGGTKVKHSLGSFTFRRGEAKPGKPITNYEQAFKNLLGSDLVQELPDGLRSDLLQVAQEVTKACTTTPVSEPSEPTLRPYWAR